MNARSFGPPAPTGAATRLPALVDSFLPTADFGAGQAERFAEGRIDLLAYWGVLLKHKWVVIGLAVTILGIGLVISLLKPSIYRASATVQIDREAAKVVDTVGVEPSNIGDAQFFQTQYEILKSRSLAERVVVALDLSSNQAYPNQPSISLLGWFTNGVRLLFASRANDGAGGSSLEAEKRAAVARAQGGISVEPVRNSRLVRINFDSQDRQEAARIANAFADQFIVGNLIRRYDASSYARQFLEEHLQETKQKLEQSERQLIQYARQEEIVNIDDRQSLLSAQLTAMSAALTTAGAERIRYEQLSNQAQTTDGLGLPPILQNEAIGKLRDRRSQLESEYRQKLNIMKPAFPEMVLLKGRIEELDRQIKTNVDVIKASIRSQFVAAHDQEASLAKQVSALKAQVLELQDRSIGYNTLKREVDTNRQLYDGLLQRYKDVGIVGGVGTNNLSIVDRAEVPSARFSPSLSLDLLLYIALGLIGGIGGAFLLEYVDDTFKSPQDIETGLGLPVLGIIPLVKGERVLLEHPGVLEAYQSLRAALQFSTATGIPRSLLITSAQPGEGKSASAEILARKLAKVGCRTLLIDADLRNPSLHRRLKKDNRIGLSSYLAGASRTSDVLQSTGLKNLTFIAAGPLPPNPVELLVGPRMPSLLAAAAVKFDVVIIDSAPVIGLADAPILASIAEGTLLIVASTTRRGVAKAALKRLYQAHAQLAGVVFNKFDPSRAGYGYGYSYGGESYYGYGPAKPKLAAPVE